MMAKINIVVALTASVVFVGNLASVASVCTGGIAGIESTSQDVCCVEACGVCGGPGCTPDANSTLTANDCCSTEIADFGELCSVTGTAPCILTTEAASDNSTCINGQVGVQDPDTDVCCPLECGDQCGGDGCGTVPGVNASQCCASEIIASSRICSDTVLPPCVVTASANSSDNSTTCSNGLSGIEDSGACCDLACGQCGGEGCGTIPGIGLTSADCCSDNISNSGTLCSITGAAPCIIDPPEVTPSTCPNGIAGVQDENVCCAEACNGVCGGVGCGDVPGTNGSSDCCSSTILLDGVFCEDGVEAPCIMINGTYTPAPTTVLVMPGTAAPSAASRGGMFTAAPSLVPTPASRNLGTGIPTMAPTSAEDIMSQAPSVSSRSVGMMTAGPTSAPTLDTASSAPSPSVNDRSVTFSPSVIGTPSTSGSSSADAGRLVTFAALVAGAFAVVAAARN